MRARALTRAACICTACCAVMAAFVYILAAASASASEAKAEAKAQWLTYEDGLARAKKDGGFVVADFYTTWCRDCKKMDKETFTDPAVVKDLSAGFAAVKVDADKRPELASKYGVYAYPTIAILKPDGSVLCQRLGYMSAQEFRVFLGYASTGAYKKKSLQEYLKSVSKGK